MSSRTDFIVEKSFKENPDERLLRLHYFFQYVSPIAIIALFLYIVGTIFYNPPQRIVLVSRVLLASFFLAEFIIEFILYESKVEFIKSYWWRAALFIPAVGFLRILGQLAQLTQLLSLMKIIEKASDTLDYYKSKWRNK